MPVILFDLMDTLVKEPYHTVVKHLFSDAKMKTEFFHWKNRENFHSFERGEISEREHFKNFYLDSTPKDALQRLPKPEKVKKVLFQNIQYRAGMEELLSELQSNGRVRTGIASNYSEWHSIFLERLPCLAKCDFLFFSCEIGHRKPEAAYYAMISESLLHAQVIQTTSEILFLDDRQINLDGANKAGWQTHLTQDSYAARQAINDFSGNVKIR